MTRDRRKTYVMNPKLEKVLEYFYVLLGSAFVAVAFNIFLLPNKVASGGVSGISTILDWTVGWDPALVQATLNIPLFFAGVFFLGRAFGLKSLVGTLFLPLVVKLTENIEPATTDPLLGALFGGIGVGLGLGIVFRGKASTGGVDLAAQILHKFTGISLGLSVALIDGLIVISSGFAFGIEQALYALIGLYVTGKTIDLVQMGLGYAKTAMIITDKEDEVRKGIFKEVNRGVTSVSGTGGYTEDKRPILLCVVDQKEVTKLKQTVKKIDPSAFVIVMNASEVLGEGFKRA
ncbi:hypothetical protein CIB95_12185 [Lottiidibacillus patelloidae]|uniref:DUF2179 domain-containing protein n=1 Tax=Lottiidibacillus patelloidae TaxID=2670334 RepID=A0A263BS32_9BACI|nr:YitT family protein [Lottiidibacillus patelloidae]OZM56523.1 hypothetical protein CIB95_12185 [Lottiidibacillus patelloidae]